MTERATQHEPDQDASFPTLPCPRCGEHLHRDRSTSFARWFCLNAHGYSNVAVLLTELRDAGIALSPTTPEPAADWSTADDWESGLVDDVLAGQPWWTEAPHLR